MYLFYPILKELGDLSLNALWFPLLVWSLVALGIYGALKIFRNSDVLYQYHTRVALVAGIPLGMLAAVAASYISELTAASSTSAQLSFIVIQNPISVTAEPDAGSAAVAWSDPYLWVGVVTALTALVAAAQLIRLVWNYIALIRFSRKLSATGLGTFDALQPPIRNRYDAIEQKTQVAFSDEVEIPFTFGWRRPVIVLPSFLQHDSEKVNLAIRHEMMHIKHADYLVNVLVTAVKSLFWFHPLLHLFDREIREYREISCDSEVLADENVSRKKYAQLLFDLAPRNDSYARPVVSMSVNRSNLNKRITTMMNLTPKRPFVKSLVVSCSLLLGISGFIACSDLQTTGVTNRDIEETQVKLRNRSGEVQPLLVVNGVIVEEELKDKALRIKPKYIKSINILKNEQATDEYGPMGKNGVIMMDLAVGMEIALADLQESDSMRGARSESPAEPFYVVVEDMPRLVGGLQNLQEEIQYPEEARKAGIEGRVIVQFIVDEQGNVENPQIIRGIGGGADEEALRVVRQAEFEPGMQRGEPVRVQYSLPIVFKLGGNSSITREKGSAYMENPKVDHKQMTVREIGNDGTGTLTGTVLDADSGNPLPGANIVLTGTSTGTSTDKDGHFRLEGLPAGDQKLSISYVGYGMVTMDVDVQ